MVGCEVIFKRFYNGETIPLNKDLSTKLAESPLILSAKGGKV